jgi:hypothetical protein
VKNNKVIILEISFQAIIYNVCSKGKSSEKD